MYNKRKLCLLVRSHLSARQKQETASAGNIRRQLGVNTVVQLLTIDRLARQVFYAPHIVRMSSVLGTRFEPLRYTLDGSRLYSNVYYR